ncbi:MAG: hypothetical protein AAF206_10010 [Bacteroidota bacterium]
MNAGKIIPFDDEGNFFISLPDTGQVFVVYTKEVWNTAEGGRDQMLPDTIISMARSRSIRDTVIRVDDESGINAKTARQDIQNHQPKLLLVGGIAPIVYVCEDKNGNRSPCPDPAKDSYGIEYVDFGCIPPPEAHLREYQQETFNWLDENYGKAWRKLVRPDVLYLKEK